MRVAVGIWTYLSTDDVHADVESLLDVLGSTNHIHAEHAGLVQLVYDLLRGDTDRTDEELGALFDDDIDELVEVSLGVVIVSLASVRAEGRDQEIDTESCKW